VQEIFECMSCGDKFAAEPWAIRHVEQFHPTKNGGRDDAGKIQTL